MANSSQPGCQQCLAGFQFNAADQPCIQCPTGWIQPVDNATTNDMCMQCESGKYRDKHMIQKCHLCPIGFFQDAPGQNECKKCFFAIEPGTTDCSGCEAGKKGFKKASGEGCDDCEAGKYAYEGNKFRCLDCPEGWHTNGEPRRSKKCVGCPAGTWSVEKSARDIFVCVKCMAGKYSQEIGADNVTSCKNCSAGRYRTDPGADHEYACKECSVGYYGFDEGRMQRCNRCEEGKYSDEYGSRKCKDCPLGWIQVDIIQGQCQKCDAGTFHNITNNNCDSCPSGYFQKDKGMLHCTACPEGYYGNRSSATSIADCTKCDYDKNTLGKASTNSSQCLCRPETADFDGFYQNGSQCEECPPFAKCRDDDVELGLSVRQLYAKVGAWRAYWNDTIFLNCSSGLPGIKAKMMAADRCCPASQNCSQINKNRSSSVPVSADLQCLCNNLECYSGPMCMVCGGQLGKNYYLNYLSGRCEVCKQGEPSMFYAVAGLIIVSILIFMIVSLMIYKMYITDSEAKGKRMDKYESEKQREKAELIDQFSIIISWAQILSSIPLTYDNVLWPRVFEKFALAASFLDIDLSVIFGILDCQLAIPFLDTLMLHLATPLAIVLTVNLAFAVAQHRGPSTRKAKALHLAQRAFADKCIFFMITMVSLASFNFCSVEIFIASKLKQCHALVFCIYSLFNLPAVSVFKSANFPGVQMLQFQCGRINEA